MRIFKLYYDKDSEEQWINEMAMQGWALEKFCLGFYTFVPSKPGEYIYQIDLLESWAGYKDDFSTFMEELGVEVISQWYRWIYLRKAASGGKFELYTDMESKLRQYQRILHFFIVGAILEFLCLLLEINGALQLQEPLVWFLTLFIAFIFLVFMYSILKCRRKIQQLKHTFKRNN